ncbi:hypothetical protein [Puniceibacterium confluentis]|uniref:hypothetical protein n=1 Tax=Puniceibacterium confluentis TaxID=1958944 RepID=UPI0011B77F05|nr:hypothetical protein [Puniceibacterium confluentis]
MILTLIISAVAGALVPKVQPQIRATLARHLKAGQLPDDAGLQVTAFAAVLILASLLLLLLGVRPSAGLVLLGGLLGYFQAEIRQAFGARR